MYKNMCVWMCGYERFRGRKQWCGMKSEGMEVRGEESVSIVE